MTKRTAIAGLTEKGIEVASFVVEPMKSYDWYIRNVCVISHL